MIQLSENAVGGIGMTLILVALIIAVAVLSVQLDKTQKEWDKKVKPHLPEEARLRRSRR